ncbi:MAG: DUF2281 domain-containing protein [Acidobacteria bacterium]|nr:DUF2281 domain-containing protein [Acidobacteriota bacterium]
MSPVLATLQEKAQKLPPQKQAELIDFAEFLLSREPQDVPHEPALDWVDRTDDRSWPPPAPGPDELEAPQEIAAEPQPQNGLRNLTFDWADGPEDPPEPYSSVELQHLASQWRVKEPHEII